MRPLRDFHPKILPYIQGCPEPALELALVDAAIDFCERTRVIHQKTEPFFTVANLPVVELDVPQFQRIVNVRSLWIDGRKLNPLAAEQAPGPTTATGKPSWFWGRRTDSLFELEFYPTPDARYTLVADASYCPTRDALQLEDDLFDLWIDAIRAGTLARLFSIPGQLFTDMTAALAWGSGYQRALAEAKRRADNTRVMGSHAIRPVRFA
jgi:hypothetical protein